MKLLLYCTKAKPYLIKVDDNEFDITNDSYDNRILWDKMPILNGKIVAECDFEVEEIRYEYTFHKGYSDVDFKTNQLNGNELFYKSCLNYFELIKYFNRHFGIDEKGICGYAIHIKNLHIFDEPKELSDYYKFDGIYNNINNWKTVDKAPQNMMYAYELKEDLGFSGTYNIHLKKAILISIKPKWLCKILNGEKTIEVRKKVLKEILNNDN